MNVLISVVLILTTAATRSASRMEGSSGLELSKGNLIRDGDLALGEYGNGQYGQCKQESALCVAIRFRNAVPANKGLGVTLVEGKTNELRVKTEAIGAAAKTEAALTGETQYTHYEQKYDVVFPLKEDDTAVSNHDVFEAFVQPTLDESLGCIQAADKPCKSAAIFAYGATGSGKSFTMGFEGDKKAKDGVLQMSFNYIFDILQNGKGVRKDVYVNAYEIYMNKVQDLVTGENDLTGKANNRVGYISRMKFTKVTSFAHARALLQTIQNYRKVSSTHMNAQSSRSHAIVHVYLSDKDLPTMASNAEKGIKIEEPPKARPGRQVVKGLAAKTAGDQFGVMLKKETQILFVDLAGNEKAQTDREGQEVNKALSEIQNCLSALEDTKKICTTRNNKLTIMLEELFPKKDAKGVQTMVFLLRVLVMINPSGAPEQLSLTRESLRFANEIKHLKVTAPIGKIAEESVSVAELNELKVWKTHALELQAKIRHLTTELRLVALELDMNTGHEELVESLLDNSSYILKDGIQVSPECRNQIKPMLNHWLKFSNKTITEFKE